MKLTIAGIIAVVITLGAGCAVDEPGPDEPTGEAQQAVSSFGIWSWGCSTTPCSLALGPAAGETCFLAGVWGNLQPAGSYSQVQVLQSGSQWGLQVVTAGRPLGGTAVCVPGNLTKTLPWHSGSADVSLGLASNRRCFLSGVINTRGFTSTTDFVRVYQAHGTWFLGGNMTSAEGVTAFATCVDGPSASPDFGLIVSDGSSSLDNPIQGNSPGGWACGLKKLGGHFTTNDYNDGVWIDYNNPGSVWELSAVNGKQTTTGCVN